MRAGSLVLLAVAASASGCVGVVSRTDGEGPLKPSLTRESGPFQEVGSGDGRVLLQERGKSRYLLARGDAVVELEPADGRSVTLSGAQLAGGALYRLDANGVLERRAIVGDTLLAPTVVARVEDARAFSVAVSASGLETVALVRPGVVLAGSPGSLAAIWLGDAYTVALDPARGAVWVFGQSPLATIDCVSLASGKVLVRLPLPRELESASVRVVPSGRSLAIYALDRPIEAALVVTPELGLATRLLPCTVAGVRDGSYDDASLPPLIVPPGRFDEERLSIGLPSAPHRGRVASLGHGRFAVIDDGESARGLSIRIVGAPNERDAHPTEARLPAPNEWPRVVEGVGWDERGAFFTSGDRRLLVTPAGCELVERHPVADSLRRGTNISINGFLMIGECGTTVVLGAAITGGVLALIPVALVVLPFVLLFSR